MRLRAAVVAVFLAVSLSACGGTDKKVDVPKYSATPSPTAAEATTGTLLDEVPSEKPERPKDVKSKAGAKNFADYVFDVVFYVLATNDIDVLSSIADNQLCQSCDFVKDQTDKRPETIQVSATEHTASKAKVFSTEGDFYTVHLVVEYPAGKLIDKKTGKKLDTLDAEKRLEGVNMQWRGGKWVLLDYDSVKKAGS